MAPPYTFRATPSQGVIPEDKPDIYKYAAIVTLYMITVIVA
jgi:hypothetical protein